MTKLTITFHSFEDGRVKATVYRDDNTYLYEALGFSEADCLRAIANRHVFYNHAEALNEAIERRG